jgi:transcription elongation factor Elf1
MTELRTPLTLTPRLVLRPRCPHCHATALVQSSTPGRKGFEHWTLRCTGCGNIHEAQVQTDPMTPEANAWFSSELRAPT